MYKKFMRGLTLTTLMLLGCLGLTSCDLGDGIEVELDGYWHLYQVDTLATGGRYMMERQTVFWSIEDNILETKILPYKMIFFRFEHEGDDLRLFAPMGSKDPTASNMDYPINDPTRLYDYGVHSLDAKFKIKKHTRKQLWIEDQMLQLYFERY